LSTSTATTSTAAGGISMSRRDDGDLDGARKACVEQRVCQHPRCRTPRASWQPHHVVYEQEVRRRGFPKWDPRNMLRLCRTCHLSLHHQRIDPVPLTALLPQNLAYAEEVLGDYAEDYLARRYAPAEVPIA
jgi:hypothetical protein